MQEQPFIHGAKDEKEKNSAVEKLSEWVKKGRTPLEGEEPKTEQEMNMIQAVNSFIAEEFERLEIKEPFIPIDSEQVHILSKEVFGKKYGEKMISGLANSRTKSIYINKDFDSRSHAIFAEVFHEMLHLASHQKFLANTEKEVISAYRLGYVTGEDKLRGLNEFLTDATLLGIWSRHTTDLQEKFSFTKDEANNIPPLAYLPKYFPLFQKIFSRVAEKRNEKVQETTNRFSRGMFTGEMMHLRDIENVYGENALEVLALLGKSGVIER